MYDASHRASFFFDCAAAVTGQRFESAEREIAGLAHQAKPVRSYIEEHARKKLRGWQWTARLLGFDYPDDGSEPEETPNGLCQRWIDRTVDRIDSADRSIVPPQTSTLYGTAWLMSALGHKLGREELNLRMAESKPLPTR